MSTQTKNGPKIVVFVAALILAALAFYLLTLPDQTPIPYSYTGQVCANGQCSDSISGTAESSREITAAELEEIFRRKIASGERAVPATVRPVQDSRHKSTPSSAAAPSSPANCSMLTRIDNSVLKGENKPKGNVYSGQVLECSDPLIKAAVRSGCYERLWCRSPYDNQQVQFIDYNGFYGMKVGVGPNSKLIPLVQSGSEAVPVTSQ